MSDKPTPAAMTKEQLAAGIKAGIYAFETYVAAARPLIERLTAANDTLARELEEARARLAGVREECAQVAESKRHTIAALHPQDTLWNDCCQAIAAAIRAEATVAMVRADG